MTSDHLIGIEQFEADLWKVADNLRANSNLAAIEEDKAAGKMPDRPLVEADVTRRRALMLPEPASRPS